MRGAGWGRRTRALAGVAAGALVAGAALTACPATTEVPGDVVVGTFRFSLEPLQDGCGFELQPAGAAPEPFTAKLSYDSHTGGAWLTSGPTVLQGTLSDGRFVVEAQADRDLPRRWPAGGPDAGGVAQCGCSGTVVERLEGRLLQDDSAGCSGAADSEDAGLLLGDGGRPIQLVCGYLSDQFSKLDTEACACDPCLVVFSLTGQRQ